jgi:acetyl/propionyl-CoA carboxylase alpha subunit
MASFHRLLVANRGEIARRVIRTARAMGIETAVVFSDADQDLPFVREADEAVRLPGSSPAATYLDIGRIVDAARLVGADAVHPGYGFLSENASFVSACEESGLVFVGPPSSVVEKMGSKISAKEIMAAAGVPVLDGAAFGEEPGPAELAAAAERIGFPILVKAALGGGGRGMRVATTRAELAPAVADAQREAASAFGDATVFLERLVASPRHIEVQILGDAYGNVVHLFERECSIQRRHQKVIEEAPSPFADAGRREEICAAAVVAGKAIGYVNAGTVEFVVDADGQFWFLEVNTRLQVEHPVTELVTGLDLVELQLRVAQGEPIPAVAADAVIDGHAIEARLYAEDPAAGFLPMSGTLDRFRIPVPPGGRVDSGYEDGSIVTTHYDAMLAKVVAWAPTRQAAAARLADMLAAAQIHGVTTNRDLLVATLRRDEFVAGEIDTGFFDRHPPAESRRTLGPEVGRLHAAAAGVAVVASDGERSPLPRRIPSRWRNVGGAAAVLTFDDAGEHWDVACDRRRDGLAVAVDGKPLGIAAVVGGGEEVELDDGGVRRRVRVHRVGEITYVDSASGSSVLRLRPRFPDPTAVAATGSLVSPMPGTVSIITVGPGERVEAGQVLMTIEAMKMEHPIRSPHAGVVTALAVAVGDQVATATPLLVLATDDGGDR